MDITKWKSVAVKKSDYDLLKAICDKKYRAPAAMISKFVNDYCEFQSKKLGMTIEGFKKKLLNGNHKEKKWQVNIIINLVDIPEQYYFIITNGVRKKAETQIGINNMKNKKTIDGYYFDGKNSFTLYKDQLGKATMKKDKTKKKKKWTTIIIKRMFGYLLS